MLFVKSLFKKSDLSSQLNTFKSIDDLPQWNWVQIHKTDNLAYLKKLDSYRKIEKEVTNELQDLWQTIYDEYLEEFGLSKEYIEHLNKKKEIARLKKEYILTGDRNILNLIDIEEAELIDSYTKTESQEFESVVVGIEKMQGIRIDPKKITVYQYNNYIRNLKEKKDGK
jgi:hypothetical protein